MQYFILRFIFICCMSYYVGIEAGWYTAAAIMILGVDSEMIKWSSRVMDLFYRRSIITLKGRIDNNWQYKDRDLKQLMAMLDEATNRIEVLELIVQPIKGERDEQN